MKYVAARVGSVPVLEYKFQSLWGVYGEPNWQDKPEVREKANKLKEDMLANFSLGFSDEFVTGQAADLPPIKLKVREGLCRPTASQRESFHSTW